MKIIISILLLAFNIQVFSQKVEKRTKEEPLQEKTLVFKYEIQAMWMQKRLKSAGVYRPYEPVCLMFKCEYFLNIEPGDEFLYKGRKLAIPRRLQLKLK